MCGIAGYAGLHRPEILEPMARALAHRGPDDEGSWSDARAGVGLAHRRLSIIDPSPAGHQPMSSPDGSIWLTYNGEIYDFQRQRRRLVAAGRPFRGHSDTEVLLALYEERGLDCLSELNGMFAFAIWDGPRRRLLLARDHAGIKPLYYWRDGPRLYFASEIKALLMVPGMPRRLRARSVVDYLTFLWVPGEHTLLADVKKLEPGHYLTWEDGEVHTRRWFQLAYEPDEGVGKGEWVERVRETLLRTTRRQMVSDVPLGAFLSGGLDSSGIVACMRRAEPDREIHAYTVQFGSRDEMEREQGADDHGFAIEAARHIGVQLESVRLDPDVIGLLPKLVFHLDEPDADPAALPCYLIARLARERGTVVLLSGIGGDEVFFGYRSHQAYRIYQRLDWLLRPPLGRAAASGLALAGALLGAHSLAARRLARFRRGLVEPGLERHLALADWSSGELRGALLQPDFARGLDMSAGPGCLQKYFDEFQGSGQLNLHSHLLHQTFLAAHNFLYTDKASMAASLEARVPFLDVELLRLAARIPERVKLEGTTTKSVLKKALQTDLPASIVHRSKTGFGVPLRQWIRGELRPVVRELLGAEPVARRGIFASASVARILAENDAGRADHAYLIYALVTLELWMRSFLDRPGVEVGP